VSSRDVASADCVPDHEGTIKTPLRMTLSLEHPYLPQQLRKQAVAADNRLLALQSAHTLNFH
jgi:hypothetical protein